MRPIPTPVIRALQAVRDAKLCVKQRFGLFDPLRIVPFRGHGTPEWLRLEGRLIEVDGAAEPKEDSFWRNAWTTLRRIESDEIPDAQLEARFQGRTVQTRSDREGFFAFELRPDPPVGPGWHEVEIELLESLAGGQGLRATGRMFVPAETAEFGVVSDLDDTVIHSAATNTLTIMRLYLFKGARSRTAFPGVAVLYRALQSGPDGKGENPIFYLSDCGWNLYDLFESFFEHNGIPPGPMFLRDLAILEAHSPTVGHPEHKLYRMRSLLRAHQQLPFVLVGDSGQRDPERYRQIIREHPGQVRAVYLRDVTSPKRDRQVHAICDEIQALGVPAILGRNSAIMAEHAAEQGLIPSAAVEAVRQAVAAHTERMCG